LHAFSGFRNLLSAVTTASAFSALIPPAPKVAGFLWRILMNQYLLHTGWWNKEAGWWNKEEEEEED